MREENKAALVTAIGTLVTMQAICFVVLALACFAVWSLPSLAVARVTFVIGLALWLCFMASEVSAKKKDEEE